MPGGGGNFLNDQKKVGVPIFYLGTVSPRIANPRTKVSLGLVEALNNKIRVIQRSAYGYRDEEYLRLKIITSFLPPLPENARLHPH